MATEQISIGSTFDIDVNRVAKGGASLGSAPDGRTTFVSGAIPGETVTAEVHGVHKSRLEATCSTVINVSDDRVTPACGHVADGCGGCDWQHISPERQSTLRADVVADCLRRLAKIDNATITTTTPLRCDDYRSTVRVAVVNGRAAYRARSSHDLVMVDHCTIAHPLIEEILVDGTFGAADEVTIRLGVNTGERMVIVSPTAAGVKVPDDVIVVGVDELRNGRNPHFHEEIDGIRFQISAESFFQCRPDGARLLAQLAGDAVADGEGALLDAYCGVGLFSALAGTGRSIVGVESNPSAVADFRINAGPHATVTESKFERWSAEPVGVVIADPARAGLKAAACDKIAASRASHVALISCDPASLARDTVLLQERNYALDYVQVVDLFGQTSHVETVSKFVKR